MSNVARKPLPAKHDDFGEVPGAAVTATFTDLKEAKGLQRKSIAPVAARPIPWPTTVKDRISMFRDWHAVAMRRCKLNGVSPETLAVFFRFVNYTGDPSCIWPSTETLAACAGGLAVKTVQRHINSYVQLGLIRTKAKWIANDHGKRKSRTIEFTFPRDLSQHDFLVRALQSPFEDVDEGEKYQDTGGLLTPSEAANKKDIGGPFSQGDPEADFDEYKDHLRPKYKDTGGPSIIKGNIEDDANRRESLSADGGGRGGPKPPTNRRLSGTDSGSEPHKEHPQSDGATPALEAPGRSYAEMKYKSVDPDVMVEEE